MMQIQNLCISDYGNLAFSIANAIWNENVTSVLDNFMPINEHLKERYADYKEFAKKKALAFILGIPGNPVNQIIIVDSTKKELSRYYRVNGILYLIIAMDMSIVKQPEVTMDELAKFCDEFCRAIQPAFDSTYVHFAECMILTQFTTFAMTYYKYRLSKEQFTELFDKAKGSIPKVSDDNKVYENLVAVIYSRNSSEALILRAVEEGVNGVESNNILKSRIVQ